MQKFTYPLKKFSWTILEEVPSDKPGVRVLCQCDCGAQSVKMRSTILLGETKRCVKCAKVVGGRSRRASEASLIGKTFGRWTILRESASRGQNKRYFECKCECGYEKEVMLQNLRGGESLGCRKCADENHTTPTTLKVSKGQKFGDWEFLGEESRGSGGQRFLRCKCKCGLVGIINKYTLLDSRSKSCRKCSAKNYGLKRRMKILPRDRFSAWTVLGDVGSSSEIPGGVRTMLCRCDCGGIHKVRLANLVSGISSKCISCSKTAKTSLPEKLLGDWLAEVTGEDIVRNSRDILGGQEIDIYLPSAKLGVEYNGNYWHSAARNSNPRKHFNKRVLAESKGIRLIQIRSDEWLNRGDVVKSIISTILGRTSNRYFARKMIVGEVSHREAGIFLEENHLMGDFRRSRKIGLRSPSGELVQLFAYRIVEGGEVLECSRICSKINSSVVGGVSRLINSTLKLHSCIKQVISFVDLRYADGHSLEKIGFKRVSISERFSWTDGEGVFDRRQCRANMDGRGLTQAAYAGELGWHRLFDAGQAKYAMNLFPSS